jgi:hypothetical protein
MTYRLLVKGMVVDGERSQFSELIFREKSELLSTVNMLRTTVSSLQQREADALRQVQQSVEVAEQAQLERVQVSHFNYKSASLSQV